MEKVYIKRAEKKIEGKEREREREKVTSWDYETMIRRLGMG